MSTNQCWHHGSQTAFGFDVLPDRPADRCVLFGVAHPTPIIPIYPKVAGRSLRWRFMEIVVLVWIICGIASGVIASDRHASGCLWFGLGVLFGPFALAASFFAGGRGCPKCKSSIPENATRCPKCQAELTPERLAHRCSECKQPGEVGATSCVSCGVAFTVTPSEPTTKKCPDCAEDVKVDARKCRFCGFAFEAEKETALVRPAQFCRPSDRKS
jgi:hypothetical protein